MQIDLKTIPSSMICTIKWLKKITRKMDKLISREIYQGIIFKRLIQVKILKKMKKKRKKRSQIRAKIVFPKIELLPNQDRIKIIRMSFRKRNKSRESSPKKNKRKELDQLLSKRM